MDGREARGPRLETGVEEELGEGVGNPPEGCWVGSRLVVPDLKKLRC